MQLFLDPKIGGNRIWQQRGWALLWLVWAIGLLTVYYRQFGYTATGKVPNPDGVSVVNVFLDAGFAAASMGLFLGATIWLLQRSPARREQWQRSQILLGFGIFSSSVVLLGYLFTISPVAYFLPAFQEATLRAVQGILGAGWVLLAAQFLGMGLFHWLRWQFDGRREALLYQISTGLGCIAYLSAGLAGLRLYYISSVQILIAIIVLGGACSWGWHWTRNGRQQPDFVKPVIAPIRRRSGDRLWQAIVLLATAIALIGALAPEQEYDALWYHLGLPKLWLQQGFLVDLPADFISLYPMTWELIFGAGLAVGGQIGAKLLHFACLPLTGLLVYQLASRFMPRASPWLAVALFVTIPIVLWESTTAYIDLALALHVGLVIYALLRYENRCWQWLLLAALNLGLALATKHLALFVLALTAIGLVLKLWLQERSWRPLLFPVLVFCGFSLLFPLPWYLRSWLASGNPVFPELFEIFGAPPDRWNSLTESGLGKFLGHFGRPRTLPNLLTLPWDMTVHAAHYDGALGPLFLLLLPALLIRRRFTPATIWLLAFVGLFLALWASPFSSFQMRFLIPITPLLAVLAAEAATPLASILRSLTHRGKSFLFAGLAVLLPLNLPPFIQFHEGDRVQWEGWLNHAMHQIPFAVVVGRQSQTDYLQHAVPSYRAWRYINTHLPTNARVLSFSSGDHFYADRERIWSDATIAHPAIWGASIGQEQKAFQTLGKLRISHILIDKKELNSGALKELAIVQPSTITNRYVVEYEDDRFILYRIR
ncbi:MAG: phospholipid carrier-dependent glycosyltransferase [Scytolyngbya sp. HA4215-MV1]|nr:phospholipid carrier-dependent glycosyltransferase [Scytolyngbya sp. HA4215-MV1]